MKKRIAMATMAIMAMFAVGAFAQGWGIGADPSTMPAPGYGRGHGGHGMHYMNGGYPCWGANGTATPPAIVVNNEAEAKKIVTEFVNANFKGYKVGDAVTVNTYRGQAYYVYATDASGNSFTFMTGAYGGVRGPMPGKIAPATGLR